MSAVSCSTASWCGFRFQSKTSALSAKPHFPDSIRISTNSLSDRLCMHRLSLVHGNGKVKGTTIQMALVDERQSMGNDVAELPRILAYDLVQGALVKWRWKEDKSVPDTPTAVLVHGILGSGKNWGTFAQRLAHEFPTWQVYGLPDALRRITGGFPFSTPVELGLVCVGPFPLVSSSVSLVSLLSRLTNRRK